MATLIGVIRIPPKLNPRGVRRVSGWLKGARVLVRRQNFDGRVAAVSCPDRKMPESLSQELAALRDRCERFARDVLIPNKAARVAGASETDVRSNVTRASREAGLFAMTQPKSVGGSEGGPARTDDRARYARWIQHRACALRIRSGSGGSRRLWGAAAQPLSVAAAGRRQARRLRVHRTRRRAAFHARRPQPRRPARHRAKVLCHRRRQRRLPERAGRNSRARVARCS